MLSLRQSSLPRIRRHRTRPRHCQTHHARPRWLHPRRKRTQPRQHFPVYLANRVIVVTNGCGCPILAAFFAARVGILTSLQFSLAFVLSCPTMISSTVPKPLVRQKNDGKFTGY